MNKFTTIIGLITIAFLISGCIVPTQDNDPNKPHDINADISTDNHGKTVEQNNILRRLENDNTPGSIKHLYIISAYSGDVLMYSTVDGKVTSSGKRLDPTTERNCGGYSTEGCVVTEKMQADGTYGSSVDYIYWFDVGGVYHQQYITGGMIVHVSSEPIAVSKVVLNLG